jgi:DNA-nicking Smr family endonuclease
MNQSQKSRIIGSSSTTEESPFVGLHYYPLGRGVYNRLREDHATKTLTINLHGLGEIDALEYLDALWSRIQSSQKRFKYLEVIHGYHHGTVLRGLVHLFFEGKVRGISEAYHNPGVTEIVF